MIYCAHTYVGQGWLGLGRVIEQAEKQAPELRGIQPRIYRNKNYIGPHIVTGEPRFDPRIEIEWEVPDRRD